MHRALAIAIMLLPLAGCGDKPESGDQTAGGDSTAAPAPLAAKPITFDPGKWQATSELIKMEVPGMPPELAKANLGQKTTFEHCMTAEQAAKPPSDFFTNNNQTTNCTTEKFAMVGGKLDATMICEDRNTPGKMTMTIKGDYQPASYTATMTMVTDGAPNRGEMKIIAATTGKRVGACDATPPKAG
jgi:hypothetical protein